MSELRDCGCWYTTNGYGRNPHPSGFACALCGSTGRVLEGSVQAFRTSAQEVDRLCGHEPSLAARVRNCLYLQHLPELIELLGTERALLHLVVKLSEGLEQQRDAAVQHSLRACPGLNEHISLLDERNRLRRVLDKALEDAESVLNRGVDPRDHNFIQDLVETIKKQVTNKDVVK